MNQPKFWKQLIPAALTTLLLGVNMSPASAETIRLGQNFQSERLEGRSGGPVESADCGYISQTPNQVLQVTERINYLRLNVQSDQGQPTLLVEGPGGRFCVLADQVSGRGPSLSGVWLPGQYSVYVGEQQPGVRNPYVLVISRQ